MFGSEIFDISWQGSQKWYAFHKHHIRSQSYKLVNLIEISWDQDVICLHLDWICITVLPRTPSSWGPKMVCTLVISSSITGQFVNIFELTSCLNLSLVVWPIIYWPLRSKISFSTCFLVYTSKFLQTVCTIANISVWSLMSMYGIWLNRTVSLLNSNWAPSSLCTNQLWCFRRWYDTHLFHVMG